MDYLDTLSEFSSKLDYQKLDPGVKEQVGWILADTLAAMVAGSAEPELRAIAGRQTDGASKHAAQLIGLGRRSTPEAAAFINGTSGTFLEMDEGNRFSRGHPAVHIIPAALALSQERNASAENFLAGVVVGYEVGSRLGAASQLRGAMHPHGTWGTLGAGAACARVAGMAASDMRQTINIAASLTTATSKQTMLEGGLVRNVYAGLSNRNGFLALSLAECGFTGERDGPSSLLGKIISESFDANAVTQGLGQDWHLMRNYFKLHSCCRYNHGTLDAIDQIAASQALPSTEDIDRIEVLTYHLAAELNDPAPNNTLAAKFSVPFAVATRIVNNSSALSSFTWDAVRNPKILDLAKRVSVAHDPAMSARLPNERPASVTIFLKDGSTRTGQAGVNRGDDASPYTREELRVKFMNLTGRIWPAAHCEKLLQATLDLAKLKLSLQTWTELLTHSTE
ncbi:MAG: MmgE/PrpD family protein [Limnohabitans sp.]|nr:MmgE/PrpD family protein [Limnohabitans sp.]